MSLRMEKVNSQIKRQLMEIVQREIDDPDLNFLSITRVETTSDLQESKVYYSLLDESKHEKAKEALENMKGLIRGFLGKRIRLKFLPQLNFILDDSMKYSIDIHQRIEDIKKEEDARENTEKDS